MCSSCNHSNNLKFCMVMYIKLLVLVGEITRCYKKSNEISSRRVFTLALGVCSELT